MAALLAIICGCTKNNGNETPLKPVPEKETMVFTASMEGCVAARATLEGNTPSWEAGDVISINGVPYRAQSAGAHTTFTTSSMVRPAYAWSSSKGYDGQGPAMLVDDGGVDTKWCADTEHQGERDMWEIIVSLKSAACLKSVKLWNGDDTEEFPGRQWQKVIVCGGGATTGPWTELKIFSDLSLEPCNKGVAGTLDVNATESYRYYKIEVAEPQGQIQMSDMQFEVAPIGPYTAYFPADLQVGGGAALPSDITEDWVDGEFNMPMYAESTTESLSFKNLCAVLKITVKSSQMSAVKKITLSSGNHAVSGIFTVGADNAAVLSDPDNTFNTLTVTYNNPVATTSAGTVFYLPLPAQTYRDLMIHISDGNHSKTMVTSAGRDIVVQRNTVYPVAFTSNYDVTDLSEKETANSYIVTGAGKYCFLPTRGYNGDLIAAADSVGVLWESFGTSEAPTRGDLITSCYCANGKIFFEASEKKGNALIGAYKSGPDGGLFWTWHLWLTDQPEEQTYNNEAGVVLDRNLGATSATPGDVKSLGLLYQWGRKDPFLNACSLTDCTARAASTADPWPGSVASDSSHGTIDYSIWNPMMYITSNSHNCDWMYINETTAVDNTRWVPEKGQYDPCPPGYKVPESSDEGLWARAFGTCDYWTTPSNWDNTNKGMDFAKTDRTLGRGGRIWYPAAGDINPTSGILCDVGSAGLCWSCTPIEGYDNVFYFCFNNQGDVDPEFSYISRALGMSVRCMKK